MRDRHTATHVAGVPGLEPRLTEPESVGLPITPYPINPLALALALAGLRLLPNGRLTPTVRQLRSIGDV